MTTGNSVRLILLSLSLLAAGCAEYGGNSPLTSGSSSTKPTSFSVNPDADLGIRIKYDSQASLMQCTRDHIQFGGYCEPSDAEENYIEYELKLAPTGATTVETPSPWNGPSGVVSVLQDGRCENGRFTLLVPRPIDSVVTSCLNCRPTYRLHYRMLSRKKAATQFDIAATGSVVTFNIQNVITTGGTLSCPQ
jgi:hypothetical protein